MKRRLAIALGFVSCLAVAQGASAPRKYAVLSLIGDQLSVVTYQPQVGSNVDRNYRRTFGLPTPELDEATLAAVERAIRKADPQAAIALLSVPPVKPPDQRKSPLDGSTYAPAPELAQALAGARVTHLVVVSRHRANARLRFSETFAGSGWIEGLGFYLDYITLTMSGDTRDTAEGFIAPYAYFKLTCIDLAQPSALRQVAVTESHAVGAMRSKEVDPWTAISADDKVAMVRQLIEAGVDRVMPDLLKQP